jgi:hypothetical protein
MRPEKALGLDTPRVMQRLGDPREETLSLRLLPLRFLAGNDEGAGAAVATGIAAANLPSRTMARSNGTAKLMAVLLIVMNRF